MEPSIFKKNIFKNSLTLKFKNFEAEKSYGLFCQNYNKKNIFFSVILLVFQLSILMLNILKNDDIVKSSSDINRSREEISQLNLIIQKISKNIFFIYTTLILTIINLILNIFTITNRFMLFKIPHLTYLCINLVLVCFRTFIYILYQINSDWISNFEIFFNLLYLIFIKIEFYSLIFSNILIILAYWLSSSLNANFPLIQSFHFTGVYMIISILGYLIHFYQKQIFFLEWKMKSDSSRYQNSLDNLSNGYICYKNDIVIISNKYFQDNMSFIYEKRNSFTEEHRPTKKETMKSVRSIDVVTKIDNTINQNTHMSLNMNKKILNLSRLYGEEINDYCVYLDKTILKSLENINPELPFDLQNLLSNDTLNLSDTLDLIKKTNEKQSLFKEFTYLGLKKFPKNDIIKKKFRYFYFEIFLRIFSEESGEINYEFIINDVSAKKEIHQTKQSIKNKSLSLAKISHEFKNPVIIISELAEEISEDLKSNNFSEIQENLSLMNNLSAYILILVKDFEVISKKEACSSVELVCSWFNLRKEVSILNGIVLTLISKKYGDTPSPLSFLLNIENNVPSEIYTDKMRLLQILINLISNSIKFTQNGSITLSVKFLENKIQFNVEDTGCGLSEDQAKNLFKEYAFKSNEECNSHGSGLGLSIVKELCSKMGSSISFSHNSPCGSIFTFAIDHTEVVTRKEKKMRGNKKENYSSMHKKILKNIKKAKTSYQDKNAMKRIKKTEIHNFSEINESQENELKYSSGDIEQMKRLELSNAITYKNTSNFSKLNTSKTRTIDSTQMLKYIPNIDSKGFLIPQRNDSNYSTMKNSYKRNSLNSNCLFNDNGRLRMRLKITSFDFSLEGEAINPMCKVKLKIKKLQKKTEVLNGVRRCSTNQNNVNIIIVDDDKIIRKSIARTVEKYLESSNMNSTITLMEISDGIECLYLLYNSIINNVKIDLILTDESMNFMTGSFLLDVVSKVFGNKFSLAILTSYEGGLVKSDIMHNGQSLSGNTNMYSRDNSITSNFVGIFSKPLALNDFDKILKMSAIIP